MFHKCFNFIVLVVASLQLKGGESFFVKGFTYRFSRERCIIDTGQIQSSGSWGNLSFLEFSYKSCLDPAAQFRFRDNGAMLNLKKRGCLAAFHNGSGYDLNMFYLYVDSVSLDTAACAQKPNERIYRAITQSDGKLTVYSKSKNRTSYETWCAYWPWRYNSQLYRNNGIRYYLGLRTSGCTKFIFGSVTCHGNMVKNANCPKDQFMVVKVASYRGLLGAKTCGLSDDYSCEVDVTCVVKKQCDGQHECSVTVDGNLFADDLCPGLSNYLYFEYQCVNTVKPYKEPCVHDVSLSYSSVPYKGVVQITTDSGTKNVCWESLKDNRAKITVCRHLGYNEAYTFVNISTPTDAKDAIFPGNINCIGREKYLSQCSLNASVSESCSALSYIECIPVEVRRLLLEDKRRFPDSSFSASASSEGHSASDARISSGSSWCAPVSNDKHYLQVDLTILYYLYSVVTYGDSISSKWVATYSVNYTVDLLNWKTGNRIFQGNKNAYDHAAVNDFSYIQTRALRFIPLAYVGQPCMRFDIWGKNLTPDKPTNLTVTNITSRSAEISWLDPKDRVIYGLISRFSIKLKKENSQILSIITRKVNEFKINNLTSYTTYEISVAAGNRYVFGEEIITSFLTSEEAPSGPPLNIKTTSRSVSSLLVTWDPPEKTKQNGIIISYTACVSRLENGSCFQTFISSKGKWLVGNLNASTKYYVRVLASTKAGHGNYSESKEFFTNGRAVEKATAETLSTLTFSLKKPSKPFLYFYVVAFKLKDNKEPTSSDTYENNELMMYVAARRSTNPKPYIAAVITSSGVDGNIFVLGDGGNTSDPKSRQRRSTTSDYFNGPLEPGTSYSIFQRIMINDKGDYYSTGWSPASKTSENTVSGQVSGTNENDGGSEKYLAGIIVLVILLVISLVIIAYQFVYRSRVKSPNTEANSAETTNDENDENNPRHNDDTANGIDDIANEIADDYEQVDNEQLTYTALKRRGRGEEDDGHVYAHLLNQVRQNVFENQGETRM